MLVLILVLSIFISGCGGECKVDSDCAKKECFNVKCIKKECVETIVDGCCGNGVCDSNESKCSCDADCGKCFGLVGNYMEMLCEDDKCFTGVKKENIKEKTFSHDFLLTGSTVSMKAVFEEPFNIDESMANIKLELKQRQSNALNPKITKVQIKGIIKGQTSVLGEIEMERTLWEGLPIEINIPLTILIEKYDEKATLTIIINYDYTTKVTGADDIKKSASVTRALGQQIVFIDPEKERKCPASCDDDNDCTEDSCSESTNYFCEHKIKNNCKGNYICEAGEDKCTASSDCGKCEGDVSKSVYLACIDNVCNSLIKSGAQQPITMSDKATPTGYFKWNIETTYDQPFDISSSLLKLEIRLESIQGVLALPIKITEIRVKEGSVLLGKKSTSSSLSSAGSIVTENIQLNAILDDYEKKKNINVEIDYDYTANEQEYKANTYTKTYSMVNFAKTGPIKNE